jgi:hypothetical protein
MSTLLANSPVRSVAEVLHAAAAVGHDAWATRMTRHDPPSELQLSKDLLRLFSVLRDRRVAYVLVGGIALLRYIEGRNTQDIDLLLSAKALPQLPELVLSDQNRDFARGKFKSVAVDVLFTENPLFELVHERCATTHQFQEVEVRIATVEGLLLLKLYALPSLHRQGDGRRIALYEADITMLCQRYRPPVDPLLGTLAKFVEPGAMHELRNIMADIQRRIDRVDRSKGP